LIPDDLRAAIRIPIKQWGSIMWALISFLYRKYCRARLIEMRKYDLAS
jgi:hypothetical protein